jgi:hypothetical protein
MEAVQNEISELEHREHPSSPTPAPTPAPPPAFALQPATHPAPAAPPTHQPHSNLFRPATDGPTFNHFSPRLQQLHQRLRLSNTTTSANQAQPYPTDKPTIYPHPTATGIPSIQPSHCIRAPHTQRPHTQRPALPGHPRSPHRRPTAPSRRAHLSPRNNHAI